MTEETQQEITLETLQKATAEAITEDQARILMYRIRDGLLDIMLVRAQRGGNSIDVNFEIKPQDIPAADYAQIALAVESRKCRRQLISEFLDMGFKIHGHNLEHQCLKFTIAWD